VISRDIEKVQHSRLNVSDRPTSANQTSIVSHLRYRAFALKASNSTMDCDRGGVVEGRRVGRVTLNSKHFVSQLLCLKTSKLLKMMHIKLIQQSHTVSENRCMCLLNLKTFEGIHSEGGKANQGLCLHISNYS